MDEILKKFDQEKQLLSLLLSFIDSEEKNDDFSGLNSFIQKQEDSTKTDICKIFHKTIIATLIFSQKLRKFYFILKISSEKKYQMKIC